MNKVPTLTWWKSMGLRKSEPTCDTDFADMGTAFGLDASMSPMPEHDIRDPLPSDPFNDRLNRRSVL
jgi:hypothetical protein